MLAVVDWGAPGVPVVVRALVAAGARPEVVATAEGVRRASRLVLPGVGDFGPARRRLAETGLDEAIVAVAATARPMLAICLGLQLCCTTTEEEPSVSGLGLLPAHVVRFRTAPRLPHVAWAPVTPTAVGRAHRALQTAFGRGPLALYHVHSYHPTDVPADALLATAEYDAPFPTLVGHGSVLGAQFHPEMSRAAGVAFLRGFLQWSP